jgi:hypothetical protein
MLDLNTSPTATLSPVLASLLRLKGQIVTVVIQRPLKVRKGAAEVIKTSKIQLRAGVVYDNQKAVIEKRENGDLPAENAGLPWGQWSIFPYVITHKGASYFRFATLNGGNQTIVTFTRNGVAISKDEAMVDALASEKQERESLDTVAINVNNILEVNGETV